MYHLMLSFISVMFIEYYVATCLRHHLSLAPSLWNVIENLTVLILCILSLVVFIGIISNLLIFFYCTSLRFNVKSRLLKRAILFPSIKFDYMNYNWVGLWVFLLLMVKFTLHDRDGNIREFNEQKIDPTRMQVKLKIVMFNVRIFIWATVEDSSCKRAFGHFEWGGHN